MKALLLKSISRISTKVIVIALLVVLALSLTVSITLGILYRKTRLQLNPNQLSEKEVKAIVTKVSSLIALPDETPTVATVTDKEKLSGQPFFENSENGDKVLIFQSAQKAYLYRPSDHKIIEVAPLVLEASDTAGTTTNAVPEEAEVEFTAALYNGTPTVGLTNRYQQSLNTAFPKATVVTKQNASRSDYEKSFIVDVLGSQNELVSKLSSSLQLPVQELPESESTPSAQVLIILGTDRTQ